MSKQQHPDYPYEIKRLRATMDYIEHVLDTTEEYKNSYSSNIRQAMVDLDFLDSSQSYINVLTNTKLLEMADKSFRSLSHIRKKPYFCRIDLRSESHTTAEKIYIGKASLFRRDNHLPIIIDWRSPVANLYYEGRLGSVQYEAEQGTVHCELILKRQYSIEEGQLEDIRDIDVTARDELLQTSLQGSNNQRLKDIVSTIQAEQNRIIRADMYRPLIVQGVAGSGKTTIALHRIAYFIYTNADRFDPDSFMILAPNRLFLNYISDVLPELGVDNVVQSTFPEFVQSCIGTKYKMNDTEGKLITLLDSSVDSEARAHVMWTSGFKGSLAFQQVLDQYIQVILVNLLPKNDFKIGSHTIYPASTMQRMLVEDYRYLPIYKRLDSLKKVLQNHLNIQKNKILKQIEDDYDNQMESVRHKYSDMDQRRPIIIKLMDEKEQALLEIEKLSKHALKHYMDQFPKDDVFKHYTELFNNEHNRDILIRVIQDESKVDFLCRESVSLLHNKRYEIEDTGALLYLQYALWGTKEPLTIRSVVIDEAQDFSLFQILALRTILNTSLLTVLGDLAQGIHGYRGMNNWEDLNSGVFEQMNAQYVTLENSYRTTIEIMDLANQIITQSSTPDLVLAKPVVRHGDKPVISEFNDLPKLALSLLENIQKVKSEGHRSIAIITKTIRDAKTVRMVLQKMANFPITILSGKEEIRTSDINIIPSYLAKGLEFDVVFIVNVHECYTVDDLDIKLLYVAMTRPLHKLSILCLSGTIQPLEVMRS
jgi:DNA helicase-2/ATP-dependent DNA helicase PcrA